MKQRRIVHRSGLNNKTNKIEIKNLLLNLRPKKLLNYLKEYQMMILNLWDLVQFGLDQIGWFVKF